MLDTVYLGETRSARALGRLRTIIVAAGAAAMLLVFAATASALSPEEKERFLQFSDCPLTQAGACVVSDTTGGEFIIGTSHKAVPLTKPILMQGGLPSMFLYEPKPLIAAADGNTLAKVPEEVPGGLVGIGNLGGEVTATAEIAGPASSVLVDDLAVELPSLGPAVTLPLKIKLNNELLGENCYIGSDSEPVVLHLTTGATHPPNPKEAIAGSKGTVKTYAKEKLLTVTNAKLVDNAFAVPAAKGCGGAAEEIVDTLVNDDIGLPAAAGSNTAIMIGSLAEAKSEWPAKFLPKKKKERKKQT